MLLANQIQNNTEQDKHSKDKETSSSYKSVSYGDADTARVLYNSPDLGISLS